MIYIENLCDVAGHLLKGRKLPGRKTIIKKSNRIFDDNPGCGIPH